MFQNLLIVFNTPKIEFNSIDENDDIPTNYDSEEDDDDVVGVGVATNNNNNNDDDDEEEEDDDEDGEDTFDTINIDLQSVEITVIVLKIAYKQIINHLKLEDFIQCIKLIKKFHPTRFMKIIQF